jgi:hypothetical protein
MLDDATLDVIFELINAAFGATSEHQHNRYKPPWEVIGSFRQANVALLARPTSV